VPLADLQFVLQLHELRALTLRDVFDAPLSSPADLPCLLPHLTRFSQDWTFW